MWLIKRNIKRKTESLLMAVKNNAVRTNHIKARIDRTQQNSNCRICRGRDETINHIINENSKLEQKEYKTRHDWVGEGIHRELCKKFKFDHTNKCYIHNPTWYIQTPLGFWHTNGSLNFGQSTKPYNNQQNEENFQNCGLSCSTVFSVP